MGARCVSPPRPHTGPRRPCTEVQCHGLVQAPA
jgi:hypothetical protein